MESRVIEITPAARRYGNLNLRPCGIEFFPPDVFGGSQGAATGVAITLKVKGLSDPVETDIPTDAKTGSPRWIFRKRKWVREFVRSHNPHPGGTVTIARLSERTWRTQMHQQSHGSHYTGNVRQTVS